MHVEGGNLGVSWLVIGCEEMCQYAPLVDLDLRLQIQHEDASFQ